MCPRCLQAAQEARPVQGRRHLRQPLLVQQVSRRQRRRGELMVLEREDKHSTMMNDNSFGDDDDSDDSDDGDDCY